MKVVSAESNGTPIAGTIDGEPIDDGTPVGWSSYTGTITLTGSITDPQALATGAVTRIPRTVSGHFQDATPQCDSSISLDDIKIFSVSCSTTGITLTASDAASKYSTVSFTIRERISLAMAVPYRPHLTETTTSYTYGSSTLTIENKPYDSPRKDTNAVSINSTSNAGSVYFNTHLYFHAPYNLLADGTLDLTQDEYQSDNVVVVHVKPATGVITKFTMTDYDRSTIGLISNDAIHVSNYPVSTSTHYNKNQVTLTEEQMTDAATAAQYLQPGQYAWTQCADGSYVSAVNYGPFANAITTYADDDYAQDTLTNTLLDKARSDGILPNGNVREYAITFASSQIVQSATVTTSVLSPIIGSDGTGTYNTATVSSTVLNNDGDGTKASYLTYDANTSTATGTTATINGTLNDKATVSDNGFTYENHRFTGWNTKPDGTGTTYQPGDSYTLVEGGSVLYAQWAMAQTVLPSTGQADDNGMSILLGCSITAGALILALLAVRRSRTKPTI